MNIKEQLIFLENRLGNLSQILLALWLLLILLAISGGYIIYLQHIELKTICNSYPSEKTIKIEKICKIYN